MTDTDQQLPMDTILDREPLGLTLKAVELLKLVYLSTPAAVEQLLEGVPSSRIIDAFEMLRRQGLLQVVDDGTSLTVRPTETGSMAAQVVRLLRTPAQGQA